MTWKKFSEEKPEVGAVIITREMRTWVKPERLDYQAGVVNEHQCVCDGRTCWPLSTSVEWQEVQE